VGLARISSAWQAASTVFNDVDRQFANVKYREIIARNPDVIVIHA
jgi:hypothetical protein